MRVDFLSENNLRKGDLSEDNLRKIFEKGTKDRKIKEAIR